MKNLTQLATTLACISIAGIASAQQSAVNIVFTDANSITSIDTVIDAGDEALEALYTSHGLSNETVHEIRMDDMGIKWEGDEQIVRKVMIVETEDEKEETKNAGPRKEVRIVKIETNGEDLSEEELVELEERIAANKSGNSEEQQEHVVIKKRIVMDKVGNDSSEEDVKIEVKKENGKETVVAYRNGVLLNDEETKALMEEHGAVTHIKGDGEPQMMFISEDGSKHQHVEIEQNEFVTKNVDDLKAIVIIKTVSAKTNKANETSSETKMGVFPNPSKETINANLEGVSGNYVVRVTNLIGQQVIEERGSAEDGIQHQLNVKGLDAGTYIISINHSGGLQSNKIVIE